MKNLQGQKVNLFGPSLSYLSFLSEVQPRLENKGG
jgi:hypothetical protein